MNIQVAFGRAVVLTMAFAVTACGASEGDSKNGFDAGVHFSDAATTEDAGLPTYPGSKPYKESDQSSSAANIGLSTPLFGIKVVAMNLETPDEPERVAAFYKQAMAKYGTVLDCSDSANVTTEPHSSDTHGDKLVCDTKELGSHKVIYKVGTEGDQRIVAIKSHNGGTRYGVVHLNLRK